MDVIPTSERDGIRDRRIEQVEPLDRPSDLLAELPLPPASAELVIRSRDEITAILDSDGDRILAVVGPCSVHDIDAARSYAEGLATKAKEIEPDVLIAMRVYFEKPRTTTGWKGLINDPHLDDSGDVNTGLRMARELLLAVLELGLPVGCEFLDPITPQYISDTVSWGAIGARTTESQIHRQLGSGLSMPVGFKNGTDGNVQIAVDAIRAAAVSHAFTGVDSSGTPAILRTSGNRDGHTILRGGRNSVNYGADEVAAVLAQLAKAGLPERVIIDASHDNSDKDPKRQRAVATEIAKQIAGGSEAIVGVMLESFIVAGRQDLGSGELTYGQSITDACMDWETTSAALDELAEAVRARRGTG
ncbi:3-deoxy-7-phosphoheptulonate synthase [soil metagenome]